jgi:hypothetical protein
MSRRALPDGDLSPVLTIVGSPLPATPTARRGHEALLATVVLALLARLPRERFGVRRAVRALWARLA